MLKRLLSRDTKSKVAERAKTALEVAPAVAAAPPVQPAPAKAEAPAIPRKTKSMRDSDVKDEFGRSAEELAAESAKEFDMLGLAARVSDMEDRPDRPRKSASTGSASSSGEFGVVGANPPPAAAPAAAADPAAPDPVAHIVEAKPQGVRITDGHISRPGTERAIYDATIDARDAYWDAIGTTDTELQGYKLCPELRGAPAWPTQIQTFRIVRTQTSLIIASEGLSDPFAPFQGPTDVNGFGMEVFIELHHWNKTDADQLRAGWAFNAIEQFARICAHANGLADALEEHGVLSLDLPLNCAPIGWVVPGVAEPSGGLVNLPVPPGRSEIRDTPLSPVRVVPLTLIFPEELEDCIIGGAAERRSLANDLLTTGYGHKTDPKRSSLR